MLGLCVLVVLLAPVGPVSAHENTPQSVHDAAGKPIARISISGLGKTKEYVVRREIWSKVGEPLDPDLVVADLSRLDDTGIFGAVSADVVFSEVVRDSTGSESKGVVLSIQVHELPWIIPAPALSYTEENGFSVGLGVSSGNLTGRGIKAGSNFLVGGTTTFNIHMTDPWISGNHFSLGMRAWYKERPNQLLDFYETTNLIQLNAGTYLGHHGRLNGLLGYYGLTSDTDGITLTSDNHDNIFAVGTSLGLDSRDSWRSPHRGWQNEVIVAYFGGDANTWNVQLDINRYIPINQRQTIAIGPILSLQSGEVDEQIPQYFQYFLGGVNSIRGYKLLDLGPTLFGANQFFLNSEYRWIVRPMRKLTLIKWTISYGIEVAAFADAGVAWTRAQDFNMDRARAGAGAGIRLLVPGVESVRFDFGVGKEGKLLFNFGIRSIFDTRRAKIH